MQKKHRKKLKQYFYVENQILNKIVFLFSWLGIFFNNLYYFIHKICAYCKFIVQKISKFTGLGDILKFS